VFSDELRCLKILVLEMILLALCLYSYTLGMSHSRGISRLLDDSQAREGVTVKIPFAKVIKLLGEDRILSSSRGKEFEVRTRQGPIRLGERISVTGRICKEGYLEAETIVIHRYRWLKKLVSALAAVVVCLLAATRYRISLEGRCIVDRDSCLT
jgi:hypothetical protein